MPVNLKIDKYVEQLDENLQDSKKLKKLPASYSVKEMNSYLHIKSSFLHDEDSEELIRDLGGLNFKIFPKHSYRFLAASFEYEI